MWITKIPITDTANCLMQYSSTQPTWRGRRINGLLAMNIDIGIDRATVKMWLQPEGFLYLKGVPMFKQTLLGDVLRQYGFIDAN